MRLPSQSTQPDRTWWRPTFGRWFAAGTGWRRLSGRKSAATTFASGEPTAAAHTAGPAPAPYSLTSPVPQPSRPDRPVAGTLATQPARRRPRRPTDPPSQSARPNADLAAAPLAARQWLEVATSHARSARPSQPRTAPPLTARRWRPPGRSGWPHNDAGGSPVEASRRSGRRFARQSVPAERPDRADVGSPGRASRQSSPAERPNRAARQSVPAERTAGRPGACNHPRHAICTDQRGAMPVRGAGRSGVRDREGERPERAQYRRAPA